MHILTHFSCDLDGIIDPACCVEVFIRRIEAHPDCVGVDLLYSGLSVTIIDEDGERSEAWPELLARIEASDELRDAVLAEFTARFNDGDIY